MIDTLYLNAIQLVLDDAERQLIKLNKNDKNSINHISIKKNEILRHVNEYKIQKSEFCIHKDIWRFAINLTD